MKPNAQTICLWISIGFGAMMLLALMLFPGFFPPMSPQASANQVAAFYQHHTAMIRLSMVIINFSAVMLVPLYSVVVVQMKRMGDGTQVLAYGYLSATATGATLFALADLFWLIAAFRPDRDPQLTQLLNDLAWITFTAPVGMVVAQNLCLALAVYLDRRADPVLPRWFGHLGVLVAALVAPSAGAAVLRTGPLAWNGMVSFWLRNSAYGIFLVVMFVVLRAAVRRQAVEETKAGSNEHLPAEPVLQ